MIKELHEMVLAQRRIAAAMEGIVRTGSPFIDPTDPPGSVPFPAYIPKPASGQVALAICGEDGAKAWVSCSRDVLATDLDHLLRTLDFAQNAAREVRNAYSEDR
jgi:hypothetical protein